MPEGPSIVILKEAVQQFAGRSVIEASGNTKALEFIQPLPNSNIAYANHVGFRPGVRII